MIRYQYTLEESPDESGLFWVQRNSIRVMPCPTRSSALKAVKAFRKADGAEPKPRNVINAYLKGLIDWHGIQVVRDHLDVLSENERLAVNYSLTGIGQTEIAKKLNLSQPSVSYLLKRSAGRLEYVITRPFFDPRMMESDLAEILDLEDVRILLRFWNTGCQTTVAQEVNRTQGFVRYRVARSLPIMKTGGNHRTLKYAKAIEDLIEAGGILHHPERTE